MIKLIELIKEDFIGKIGSKTELYLNPKSITRMKADLRALSLPDGDFIVMDDAMSYTHMMMVDYLNDDFGYSIPFMIWDTSSSDKGYLTWQRYKKTNNFYLGETTQPEWIDKSENKEKVKKYIKKINRKNSKYKFHTERIIDI